MCIVVVAAEPAVASQGALSKIFLFPSEGKQFVLDPSKE
jgi:hypothetical protein